MVATLIRVLGDFDLAEEAVQDAFVVALERWPRDGVPAQPGGLAHDHGAQRARSTGCAASAAREKTAILRRARGAAPPRRDAGGAGDDETRMPDDRLRLIFTCCHPALAPEAQVALTLRTLGGLTTPRDRARVPRPRADDGAAAGARQAQDPRRAASRTAVPRRRRAAGPAATRVLAVALPDLQRGLHRDRRATTLVRRELCAEAIRLAGVLVDADARRARGARAAGADAAARLAPRRARRRRRRAGAARGAGPRALGPRSRSPRARAASSARSRAAAPGPYQLQAAIAAVHAGAGPDDTDWAQIAALYDAAAPRRPSPVVALNRAVAVAMADGPGARPDAARRARGERRSTATTCSTPRAPTCCAASAATRRRPPPTRRALEQVTSPVERAFLEGRVAGVTKLLQSPIFRYP